MRGIITKWAFNEDFFEEGKCYRIQSDNASILPMPLEYCLLQSMDTEQFILHFVYVDVDNAGENTLVRLDISMADIMDNKYEIIKLSLVINQHTKLERM